MIVILKYGNLKIMNEYFNKLKRKKNGGGLGGVGDGGWGIGDGGLGPIHKPESPMPHPQCPILKYEIINLI